MKTKTFPS